MQPLNLFLRAFFASRLPAQCNPISQHILLVPPTEFWLTHKDRETAAHYPELLTSDEFLACHIIRVQQQPGKDATGAKDAKTKAKQFTTINGRTLVIKDNFVYTNKGFKNLNQAQILSDTLYNSDSIDSPQWLIYYISRPLVGTPEPLFLSSAAKSAKSAASSNAEASGSNGDSSKQKHIKTFSELMSAFPIIARQLMPQFERLFKAYADDAENAAIERATRESLSPTISHSSEATTPVTTRSRASSHSSHGSSKTHQLSKYVSNESASEEQHLRRSLEDLIYSGIDLFQGVDQNQLSLVGSQTNLSGPLVERLIERYVTERFHENVLFPRLSSMLEKRDIELEANIKPMVDIDVSQVGIAIEDMHQRKQLTAKLVKAVETFRKMNSATGPQHMIEILLETQRCLSDPTAEDSKGSEKIDPATAMNADMLVSLMLIVVIRAPVGNLQARLAYMRDFVFVEDVDTGEKGYALSTFEAVLEYLRGNASGLRRAARANRALWLAVRGGDLEATRRILEPSDSPEDAIIFTEDSVADANSSIEPDASRDEHLVNGFAHREAHDDPNIGLGSMSGLSHVFPFISQASEQATSDKPKLKKRVSMEARSMSTSSARSYMSGSSTLMSVVSNTAIETTPEQLVHTEDSAGNSVLMMAVEGNYVNVLTYLLDREDLFDRTTILQTRNRKDTTLLSAAIQTGNRGTIDLMLEHFLMLDDISDDALQDYFSIRDTSGRSVAHYIFHAPYLIEKIGSLLPWRLRDKNGQTPLMAIFRSYDHDHYRAMVEAALDAALQHQGDGEMLHLDHHVDIRGNTLLHIVNDPEVTKMLLFYCDADPNARNEKLLTPLMTASRFGRVETIRILFGDPRLDVQARDQRGMTAAELAKDDEVRSRIDSLTLVQNPPDSLGRRTAIVRAGLFEDAHVRMVIKSMSPNMRAACRRLTLDIDNITRWLAIEHPASWMPKITAQRSPFQISPRASRAVIRDLRWRYDRLLKLLLTHPTFGNHEMLWEFMLVEEMPMDVFAERTQLKASNRVEKLREDYEPLLPASFPELEVFVAHAHEQVIGVHNSFRQLYRSLNNMRNVQTDLSDATMLQTTHIAAVLTFVPLGYISAFRRYSHSIKEQEFSAGTDLHYSLSTAMASLSGLLTALDRPSQLIGTLGQLSEQFTKHMTSMNRSLRIPSGFGLLEDLRSREQNQSLDKAEKARSEMANLGRELRYTQQTVAAELAAWHSSHADLVKTDLARFVRRTVVAERSRLEEMQRALRMIRDDNNKKPYL